MTGRVLMPRFALGLGLLVIFALSTGLGVIWAGRGEQFQFQVTSAGDASSLGGGIDVGSDATVQTSAGNAGSLGGGLDVGSDATLQLGGQASRGFWTAKFKLLGVENGVVHLDVQTHNFEAEPKATEVRQEFAVAAHHVYQYVPRKTLEIPVEGGDTLTLVGKLVEKQAEKNAPKLAADAIQLSQPVLFRDGKLLADLNGDSAGDDGENAGVGIIIPKEGRYFLMLNPIENALPATAYFGHVRFQLDGKNYLLSSATSVTGDVQPRQIWVYHDQLTPEGISHPSVGAGDIYGLIKKPE